MLTTPALPRIEMLRGRTSDVLQVTPSSVCFTGSYSLASRCMSVRIAALREDLRPVGHLLLTAP